MLTLVACRRDLADLVMDISDLKKYFDQKFDNLLTQPIPKEKPVVLQSKGNQAQIDHQLKVLEAFAAVDKLIDGKKYDEAKEQIGTITEEVRKLIKLIKLADKSEGGWATVAEYLTDELASDSDDEKRIKKAEAEAQKKRKKKKEEFTNKRRRAESQRVVPPQSNGQQFFRSKFRRFSTADRCYACGLSGHWRNNCPTANGSRAFNQRSDSRGGTGSQF